MRVLNDAKPASERPEKIETGVLSVFRMPAAGPDADRRSGVQRSLARRRMGLAVPGSVQSRERPVRHTAFE